MIKQFVVDYTTATFEPLTEHEVGGLDYRYVYGNDRLSVNITGVETSSGNLIENGNQIRLYYHMDYLGTADYLTSPVTGKVTSWTHYNEWGEITHNAVLKTGQRELDLVKRYATHDYDAVLGMYYAKARMYDAENRRFASVDPVKGRITEPMTLVQYLYVVDNPLRWVDPLGLVVRLNGEVLQTSLIGGKEYVSLRGAISAYNGYLTPTSSNETFTVKHALTTTTMTATFYSGEIDEIQLKLVTRINTEIGGISVPFQTPDTFVPSLILRSQFYTANITSNYLKSVNGSLLVDVEYFVKIMCEFGINSDFVGPPVTKEQLIEFGWADTSDKGLNDLNNTLLLYGIDQNPALPMFMATIAAEGGYGERVLEQGSDNYFAGKKSYDKNTRGAGYIQLTGANSHKLFLDSVGDNFSGKDTATYIAENYPWRATGWYWKNAWNGMLARTASTSSAEGYFLAVQYYVNGWPEGLFTHKEELCAGKYLYVKKDDPDYNNTMMLRLNSNGEYYHLPKNWSDRLNAYKKASEIFQ